MDCKGLAKKQPSQITTVFALPRDTKMIFLFYFILFLKLSTGRKRGTKLPSHCSELLKEEVSAALQTICCCSIPGKRSTISFFEKVDILGDLARGVDIGGCNPERGQNCPDCFYFLLHISGGN